MRSARHLARARSCALRPALGALLLIVAGRAHAQEAGTGPAPAQPSPPPALESPSSVQEPSSAPAPAEAVAGADASGATGSGASAETPGVIPAAPAPDLAGASAQSAPDPAELSAVELAALGLNAQDEGLDTDLHFSGFMDVNAAQLLNAKQAPLATATTPTQSSFFVGHLNLYTTKNITDSFRMMTEVRFTYIPNGSSDDALRAPTTYTTVRDYTGAAGYVRWGGIVIERAYGEWSPLSFLNLRFGAFLTPYGIWNVDHGSPVFVPVWRPYAVNGEFFPEHQTGIEAFGRRGLSTNLAVRYHLTVSNGLGPISEYRDLDRNKAVGGRLVFDYMRFGALQMGGSAFYGENTSGSVGFGLNGNATAIALNKTISSQFYVTAFATDVQWKFKGLLLQGEWVGRRIQNTKLGRTPVSAAGQVGVPVNAMAADTFSWAGYGLLGYRLPWWGIMPFATLEYQRANTYGLFTRTAYSQMGLNIRPTDAIVFKVEYEWNFAGTASTLSKAIAAQLAWAF